MERLEVDLGTRRRFVLTDVSTGMPGIDFLHHYELFVHSCGLQMIDPSPDIKVTVFNARKNALRITRIRLDIPDDFQLLFIRFSN